MLLDVDRRQHVVAHETLGDHDRVLVVVTLPGHERHEKVLAECELAVVCRRSVRQDVPLADLVARLDQRLLVDAGALVRAAELGQPVRGAAVLLVVDDDRVARDLGDGAVVVGDDEVAGVAGGPALDAGADERRGGAQQRHRLALHVGAHERAVGVVVLEERDEARGHRDDLLRRHVHVVDLARVDVRDLAAARSHQHLLVEEPAPVVDSGVGLGDDVAVLVVGGEVLDLLGGDAVAHLPVRRLDEAEPVDAGVRRQVADEADVRAFRRLDRAHPPVVAGVYVTNLEPSALTRQASGPEGGEAPLVGEPGERVRLVHELAELARAEELLDGGDDGPDVDERLRRDRLDVLGGHALADDALHARQTDADLVLDQLTDRPHPAVAEVVDVVGVVVGVVVVQLHQVRDRGEDVGPGERELLAAGRLEVETLEAELRVLVEELLRDLVPADLGHVVALRVEEEVLEQAARRVGCRRLTGAELPVDVDERRLGVLGVVLLERVAHRVVRVALRVEDQVEELLVALPEAERLEQHGDGLLALAVDPDVDDVLLVDLELEPGATTGDDLGVDEVLLGRGLVGADPEVHARRPHHARCR